MSEEELKKMPTSELLEMLYRVIRDRAEELIEHKAFGSLNGYDDDILSIFFSLKQGGYND